MSNEVKILAFAGSTRKASFNRKLLAVAVGAARDAGAEVTHIDLRDYLLPLYDGDLESDQGLPEPAIALKALFKEHQALLIASPEYNSGNSAVLKNTIDWVSRPHGEESGLVPYAGKVAGLLAASPGKFGGIRGLAVLRQSLTGLGVTVVPQQHALTHAGKAFDDDGNLKDSAEESAIAGLIKKLIKTTERLSGS